MEIANDDLTDGILPTQYNDLIRRRSLDSEGDYRLLWAVLEDAIRTYLTNRARSNLAQRRRFEEVHNWFEPGQAGRRGLFDFLTICDILEIDSGRLLKRLKSSTERFPLRRCRFPQQHGARILAA
jgi:hypothetical protein